MPKINIERGKKMKTIVEEFKTYLMEDGKSNTTIQSYVGDVAGLQNILKLWEWSLMGN